MAIANKEIRITQKTVLDTIRQSQREIGDSSTTGAVLRLIQQGRLYEQSIRQNDKPSMPIEGPAAGSVALRRPRRVLPVASSVKGNQEVASMPAIPANPHPIANAA
jgi:hypothetical protein